MVKKIFGVLSIVFGSLLAVVFFLLTLGLAPETFGLIRKGMTEDEIAYAVGYIGAFILIVAIGITLSIVLFRTGLRWIKTKKQPDGEHLPLDADLKA